MPRPPMMVQNPLMGGYRSGGFRGLMGNPLFHAGIGLLSQGPSLVPQSPLQGLGAGLQSYAAAQQMLSQQDLDRQRLEMEREKLEAAQAGRQRGYLEDAEQRRARIDLAIAGGMSPEQAERLASAGMLGGQLEQQMAPPDVPTAVQTAQWLMEASPEERQAFLEMKRAGAQNINIGAQGYKPQTQAGKIAGDLAHYESLPPSPERDATIKALRAQQAKFSRDPAEIEGRAEKYETTLSAARRFDELAEANPSYVGPIEGRMQRAQAAFGTGDEVSGELQALEATMRSRLGTALSGAAIPQSEWPTYEAQLPSLKDSPERRAGKMKALEQTMAELERIRQRRQGQLQQEGVVSDVARTFPAEPPAGFVLD